MNEISLILLSIGAVIFFVVLVSILKTPREGVNHQPSASHLNNISPESEAEQKWQCFNCGFENEADSIFCASCGVGKEAQYNGDYGGAGANDFGGDPLWDDDQGLM